MNKQFYAICHKKDPVNGSWISIGEISGSDDGEALIKSLQTCVWRRNNRPTIGRLYRTDTEELVREFTI